MAYANIDDLATLYGQQIIDNVAGRGDENTPDEAVIAAALDAASSEIDSYLSSRYTTPLDPAPPYIKQICIDMAVYRMALEDAPRTAEMRLRYEDAIKYLTMVAKSLVNIDAAQSGSGDSGGGGTVDQVGPQASIRDAVRG